MANVSPMHVEAYVRATNFCFALRIDRYEFPDYDTGSDANWLVGSVSLEIASTRETGVFRAQKPVASYAPDLTAFRDELRSLDRDLSGQATLQHLEGEYKLTIALDNGKGTLAGFVQDNFGPSLRFDQIVTDQTYVREVLSQFEGLATKFPVRGDPTA